ncbi:MAG: hypothetical protein H6633_07360 [Anaerolineales bacterium]|nr:hypothetical protein [Anaerolineales bacterium]
MEKTNIQSFNFDRSLKSIYISAQTVIFAVLVGLVILNPLWSNLSPPFPILRVTPSITAPVDGPYYLQNADNGYKWDVAEPLSLWYHPFLSVMISFMPEWLPSNIWFWLLSLTFSIGSLILTYQIASIYVDEVSLSPRLLFVILFVPGGLGIATGNPEIPTLFFTLLLLLSSIKWHNWWITIIAAIFAILTKPNALYMVPILFTYAIVGYKDGNKKLYNHSITGAVIIIVSWFGWMGFVDWKTNMWGLIGRQELLSSQNSSQEAQQSIS